MLFQTYQKPLTLAECNQGTCTAIVPTQTVPCTALGRKEPSSATASWRLHESRGRDSLYFHYPADQEFPHRGVAKDGQGSVDALMDGVV